ncbi:unnamed protein product [Mytilus edulis]|uniref:Uncharacterized protein n=1 Tax=Mytilus edulis TaxID=6550 RepID=A0A8S3UJA9_MYTED|nr:unnamed protein product [Mytilus edulis]
MITSIKCRQTQMGVDIFLLYSADNVLLFATDFIGMGCPSSYMLQVLSLHEAYDFSCPVQAHWKLRAISKCASQRNYSCLFDVNLQVNVYRDKCIRPRIVGPGKYRTSAAVYVLIVSLSYPLLDNARLSKIDSDACNLKYKEIIKCKESVEIKGDKTYENEQASCSPDLHRYTLEDDKSNSTVTEENPIGLFSSMSASYKRLKTKH